MTQPAYNVSLLEHNKVSGCIMCQEVTRKEYDLTQKCHLCLIFDVILFINLKQIKKYFLVTSIKTNAIPYIQIMSQTQSHGVIQMV